MELVLIRHGQTPGNAEGRYVGSTDEPLSAEGREQAEAAARETHALHVGIQRVYVSPLRRARETAAIMFPHIEQRVVPGIEEFDFGEFEGRTAEEMADFEPYRNWVESGCTTQCPGGESRARFQDRTCTALERLIQEAHGRDEERVVVVAHGGTIMSFLDRHANSDRSYFDWQVSNCEGYRIELATPPQPKIASIKLL